jgi:hypothetical protein
MPGEHMGKTSRLVRGGWGCHALTLDGEIEHLERILAGDGAHSTFARTYWRERVMQALETPGLIPAQRDRLRRLLQHIDERSMSQ